MGITLENAKKKGKPTLWMDLFLGAQEGHVQDHIPDRDLEGDTGKRAIRNITHAVDLLEGVDLAALLGLTIKGIFLFYF